MNKVCPGGLNLSTARAQGSTARAQGSIAVAPSGPADLDRRKPEGAGELAGRAPQPLSRVVRLTLDNIGHSDQRILLHLGEPPSPVPEPLAELLRGSTAGTT